jgi:hypothetical protein
VDRHGPKGVFHVNDLYKEYASFAVDKLKKYAEQKGYHSVIIASVPGDYQNINPRKTLSKYGRKKYDSLHLKNPEISLYYEEMDGDILRASDQARQSTRSMLKKTCRSFNKRIISFHPLSSEFYPSRRAKRIR